MNKSLSGFAIGLLALLSAPQAAAVLLYQTGFESPTFVTGQLVAGQDGWSSRFNSPTGFIGNTAPKSGSQNLDMRFDRLSDRGGGLFDDASRRIFDYDAIANGTPIVRLSVDALLSGPKTQQDVLNAAFEVLTTGVDVLGQFSISADGNLYAYGSRFEDYLLVPIELGRYYNLGMEVNFLERTTIFSIDGTFLASFMFADEVQSTVLWQAPLEAFVFTGDEDLDLGAYIARYDNYSVVALPEPTSAMLFVLGLGVLLCLRRQRTGRGRLSIEGRSPTARLSAFHKLEHRDGCPHVADLRHREFPRRRDFGWQCAHG
jgi:hypothetical protein